MKMHANVTLNKNEFCAELSDGRKIVEGDLKAFAYKLGRTRVLAIDVKFEWCSGHRILTAGQQLALKAEMRRLEREVGSVALAA